MSIFTFALKENLRQKLTLPLLLLFPLVLLLVPSMPGSLPMSFSLFGLLNFYSAFLLVRTVAEDRMRGVLVRIASSPISHTHYLTSHLAAGSLLLILQSLVLLVASFIVHGSGTTNYLLLFILYCSYSVMTLSFSLAWNTMFRSYTTSFALFSGVGSILCLVSGLTFPLRFLPPAMQRMVRVLPTYWLAHGLEALYEQAGASLLLAVVILLIFAGIFLLVGSRRRL
ncbi:ABC transporter permease [uncultured Sphaerochaeta sp.]|uniref:ABC transporter permease n=1 Tax=uncultured Sphaerochaeta sp. TaxID=886478 RepID=UPI002AA8AA81|nr:ABC transporter permease [uncultured Sphaerochaeta sp.]